MLSDTLLFLRLWLTVAHCGREREAAMTSEKRRGHDRIFAIRSDYGFIKLEVERTNDSPQNGNLVRTHKPQTHVFLCLETPRKHQLMHRFYKLLLYTWTPSTDHSTQILKNLPAILLALNIGGIYMPGTIDCLRGGKAPQTTSANPHSTKVIIIYA